jgi:hypothetical protein
MYAFFSQNAADIAYECYHNMGRDHRLYPQTPFARASAEYKRRWDAAAGTAYP